MIQMDMKEMHVQTKQESFLDRLGCRDSDGDGYQTHSIGQRCKPFTFPTDDLADDSTRMIWRCANGTKATIVLKLVELQQKTSKVVLILTAMVGQTNTAAGRLHQQ